MIDVQRIVNMIEARIAAWYQKAQSADAIGYEGEIARDYQLLLSEIQVQRQNFERPIDAEG